MKRIIMLFSSMLLLFSLFSQGNKENKKVLHTIETNFSIAPAKPKEYVGVKKLLGFNYVLHYNYKDKLLIGGGLGYENNLLQKYNVTNSYIPFFVDLRYDLLDKKTTPFIGIKAGYLLGLTKIPEEFIFQENLSSTPAFRDNDFSLINSGGILIKSIFGVKFKTNKSSLSLGIGYRLQKLFIKYNSQNSENQKLQERLHNMVSVNFGATF